MQLQRVIGEDRDQHATRLGLLRRAWQSVNQHARASGLAPLEKFDLHAGAPVPARVRARGEAPVDELGGRLRSGGASGIGSMPKCSSSSSSGACQMMYTCVARELVQPNDLRQLQLILGQLAGHELNVPTTTALCPEFTLVPTAEGPPLPRPGLRLESRRLGRSIGTRSAFALSGNTDRLAVNTGDEGSRWLRD